MSYEEELIESVAAFTHDPLGFVRFAFDWATGELADSSGARAWQTEALADLGRHLQNPATRHQPFNLARSSGHGIGKSAFIGMVINWAMSTCDDTKVVVTANTKDQLVTKTSPEVAKWFKKSITAHWFEINALSIKSRTPGHAESWRTDFVTWSENNTEAFAGLHNKGKRIVLIMDEASGIADKVWEVAEGAMTDEDTEIVWIAFGNPTQNTGRFRECFGKFKHRWNAKQIDSRTVEGTNKAKLQQWIDDYGEDSDFVRVRVRGEFPRAGSMQFIGGDVVAAARKFKATGYEAQAKVLSVDVARFGDDQSVVGLRQGRKFQILAKYRGLDTVQVATRAIEHIEEHKPDLIVVDGDGLGAGVVDTLRDRGYAKGLHEFHGGASPDDPQMYFNKRAEVWGLTREWLKAGAEIPDSPSLEDDLTGPQYGYTPKQQIQLEKKDDMKGRGLSSPDEGDALAMTFAAKVLPKPKLNLTPPMNYSSTSWMR